MKMLLLLFIGWLLGIATVVTWARYIAWRWHGDP